jgi:hypothetical protein
LGNDKRAEFMFAGMYVVSQRGGGLLLSANIDWNALVVRGCGDGVNGGGGVLLSVT